jgi:hypothetical protein
LVFHQLLVQPLNPSDDAALVLVVAEDAAGNEVVVALLW